MEKLYELFEKAPVLGSLINPRAIDSDLLTADNPRFICLFWEISAQSKDWMTLRSTGDSTSDYEGRQQLFYWQNGLGELARSEAARIQGQAAWGSRGVAVRQMGELAATISSGSPWDMNAAMVVPR